MFVGALEKTTQANSGNKCRDKKEEKKAKTREKPTMRSNENMLFRGVPYMYGAYDTIYTFVEICSFSGLSAVRLFVADFSRRTYVSVSEKLAAAGNNGLFGGDRPTQETFEG